MVVSVTWVEIRGGGSGGQNPPIIRTQLFEGSQGSPFWRSQEGSTPPEKLSSDFQGGSDLQTPWDLHLLSDLLCMICRIYAPKNAYAVGEILLHPLNNRCG